MDTSTSVSLISEASYKGLWTNTHRPRLEPFTRKLLTYTGEGLMVLGSLEVEIAYKAQEKILPLLVVAGRGPSLLGRAQIFEDELGKVKGVTAKIFISPKATRRFCKQRSVPYALKSKVDQELEHLETVGVIKPVQFAECAASIVPILKRDGSIRVCGDYSEHGSQTRHLSTTQD